MLFGICVFRFELIFFYKIILSNLFLKKYALRKDVMGIIHSIAFFFLKYEISIFLTQENEIGRFLQLVTKIIIQWSYNVAWYWGKIIIVSWVPSEIKKNNEYSNYLRIFQDDFSCPNDLYFFLRLNSNVVPYEKIEKNYGSCN